MQALANCFFVLFISYVFKISTKLATMFNNSKFIFTNFHHYPPPQMLMFVNSTRGILSTMRQNWMTVYGRNDAHFSENQHVLEREAKARGG